MEKLSPMSLLIDFSIVEYFYMSNTITVTTVLFVICLATRLYQTKKTKFYFQPTLQWKDLFEKTEIINKVRLISVDVTCIGVQTMGTGSNWVRTVNVIRSR